MDFTIGARCVRASQGGTGPAVPGPAPLRADADLAPYFFVGGGGATVPPDGGASLPSVLNALSSVPR